MHIYSQAHPLKMTGWGRSTERGTPAKRSEAKQSEREKDRPGDSRRGGQASSSIATPPAEQANPIATLQGAITAATMQLQLRQHEGSRGAGNLQHLRNSPHHARKPSQAPAPRPPHQQTGGSYRSHAHSAAAHGAPTLIRRKQRHFPAPGNSTAVLTHTTRI